MARRKTANILVALAALAAAGGAAAAGPRALRKPTFKLQLAPLPAGEKAASSCGGYLAGDCSICHVSADPKKPGPVTKQGNELCFECHEEFLQIMERRYKHSPVQESCLNCHNPHNSTQKKLLHVELAAGCKDCHPAIREVIDRARVKHGAMEIGAKCASCHNPHGANVEKLLIQLPFDQCVNCHGTDDLKDQAGVRLGESRLVIHGTTIGINALLERRGTRTGLITTEGFRDVPERA